jgi:hypothetical protein
VERDAGCAHVRADGRRSQDTLQVDNQVPHAVYPMVVYRLPGRGEAAARAGKDAAVPAVVRAAAVLSKGGAYGLLRMTTLCHVCI